VIREATLGDLPALVGLEETLFGEDAWTAEVLTEELTAPHRHGWVALGRKFDGLVPISDTDPGTNPSNFVSGYAITMTVGDIADLQRIGVHPARQRHGVARALLETAMAAAKEAGADRMLLEVGATNDGALGFYAAAGSTEIDRRPRYYKDGSDAIVMRRSLAPSCSWG
jgi:ribosomal-protein-alanine N-acetyltransferase